MKITRLEQSLELEARATCGNYDQKTGTRLVSYLATIQYKHRTKMDEEAVGATDNIVTEFATYEDFLDSQITQTDLYYLEVGIVLSFSLVLGSFL